MSTITVKRNLETKTVFEKKHPIEISGGPLGATQRINISDNQARLLCGMLANVTDKWADSITEEWPKPTEQ